MSGVTPIHGFGEAAKPPIAAPTKPAADPKPTQERLYHVKPSPRVQVWDMSSGIEQAVEGTHLLAGTDATIAQAHRHAVEVDDFLRTTFGRNGWDGKGAPIRIVVHAPNDDGSPHLNNAYWDKQSRRIYLGDGDGVIFAPLGNSRDVVMHETVHAIVDSEVNLRYTGQQGGINESWADVLASIADPDDWLIGEDVYTPDQPGDSIRDLSNPRFGHVKQLPKETELEPHDYSGIPSLAAVRVADQLGRSQMGQIWYNALVDHLDSRAGFAGAARATLDSAAALFGAASSEVQAVKQAWLSVGVNARWKQPN